VRDGGEALRSLVNGFDAVESELILQSVFCASHGILWQGPTIESSWLMLAPPSPPPTSRRG